jgi:IrrE N-terminal-like domain
VKSPAINAVLQRLLEDATRLSCANDTPVDVVQVLRDLGLGLRFVHLSELHGSLERTDAGWEVIVPRREFMDESPTHLTARERFTIAHEIGHYLVEARFRARPRNRAEYWELERVCQEFAASLLMPQRILHDVMSANVLESAPEALRSSRELARRAQVSVEAAVRRLIPANARALCFARLLVSTSTSEGANEPTIEWIVQNVACVDQGPGSRIDGTSALASIASRLSHLSVGHYLDVIVSERLLGTAFRETKERVLLVLQPVEESAGGKV